MGPASLPTPLSPARGHRKVLTPGLSGTARGRALLPGARAGAGSALAGAGRKGRFHAIRQSKPDAPRSEKDRRCGSPRRSFRHRLAPGFGVDRAELRFPACSAGAEAWPGALCFAGDPASLRFRSAVQSALGAFRVRHPVLFDRLEIAPMRRVAQGAAWRTYPLLRIMPVDKGG